MVHRWNCRHCEFTIWGPGTAAIAEHVESHIVGHHRGRISNDDFQLEWDCPYCEQTHVTHEEDEGVAAFEDHLYGHVEPLIEEGVHVADAINGTGSVLVRTSLESAGADNARIHFISACDIAIVVTTNPAARIRLLHDRLDELPAWTIVITTADDPLGGLSDLDLSNFPMEIVQLDGGLGLSGLGETLSRVLSEQESASGKITVEFDIISEITDTFDLQDVFRFLHIMSSRLEKADALAHHYVNPSARSESSLNVLSELFDLTIEARGNVFVARDRG